MCRASMSTACGRQGKRRTLVPASASNVSSGGTESDSSRIFRETNILEANQRVGDGFIDSGRDPLLPINGNDQTRETLVVRLSYFKPLVAQARERLNRETDLRQKFKVLSSLVSEWTGGPKTSDDACATHMLLLQRELGSKEVPLDRVEQNGVCRHHALKCKVLCDEMGSSGVSCRLVRGWYMDPRQGRIKHLWNEVVVLGQLFISDSFFAPGYLIDLTTPAGSKYVRSSELPAAQAGRLAALGPYRSVEAEELTFLEELGSGNFGQVWLATWDSTPREVAVKRMHPHHLKGRPKQA